MSGADPERGEIPRTGHITALDGLRGLAILMVMVFHQVGFAPETALDRAVLTVLPLGESGVDLFFVLSGFLITGILVASKGAPHYYRNFYARRFLRIFPLYYAVLCLAFFVLPHLIPSRQAKWAHVAGANQLWYWAYLSNWYIALKTSGSTHGVVDVSWTLSIEEQFYLAWPMVVALSSRRTLLVICAGLIASGSAFRLAMVAAGAPNTWSHFLTPSRFDALGVGAALALLSQGGRDLSRLAQPARWTAPVALAVVLGPLVWPAAWWWPSMLVVRPAALAALFGSLLVLAISARPGSLPGRIFASSVLVVLGRYSYALYLCHNPIQALFRNLGVSPDTLGGLGLRGLAGQIVFCVLTSSSSLVLAWVSWRVFEEPILRLKRFFPSGQGRPARAMAGIGAVRTEEPR